MEGIYIFLFLLGLIAGSFLNVVSLRYKPEFYLFQNTGGRSKCPHCGKKIDWLELFPVLSFVFLLGKCRKCGKRISWQYPLVEILTGIVTAGVPFVLNKMYFAKQLFLIGEPIGWFLALSVFFILSFYFLILAAIIDYRFKIVPNEINLALTLLGLAVVFVLNYFGKFGLVEGSFLGGYSSMFGLREWGVLINHLIAMGLSFFLFFIIFFFTQGKGMGMGDVKLAGALGILFGWPDTLLLIILAFIIGAAVGIKMIVKKEAKKGTMIPFSPFLVVSSFLVFFFGETILSNYFSLFGLF
ncbi:MAG: prepilin peptidase [Candidatus Pacebacteria bacterium]|nr:prepilin peptidase [Candidatus Paceibacterota bacterium]